MLTFEDAGELFAAPVNHGVRHFISRCEDADLLLGALELERAREQGARITRVEQLERRLRELGALPQETVQVQGPTVTADELIEEVVGEPVPDLEGMSRAELRDLAKLHRVPGWSRMNMAELREALAEALAPEEEICEECGEGALDSDGICTTPCCASKGWGDASRDGDAPDDLDAYVAEQDEKSPGFAERLEQKASTSPGEVQNRDRAAGVVLVDALASGNASLFATLLRAVARGDHDVDELAAGATERATHLGEAPEPQRGPKGETVERVRMCLDAAVEHEGGTRRITLTDLAHLDVPESWYRAGSPWSRKSGAAGRALQQLGYRASFHRAGFGYLEFHPLEGDR